MGWEIGMGWNGTGPWSTAGALSGTEIPQQAPGDTSQEKTQHCVPPTTPGDTMGTARETSGSIRHAKDRAITLAWEHRKSATHEIIKVVK